MSSKRIKRSRRVALARAALNCSQVKICFVLRPEIFGDLQLPGGVLDQELLLDCFVEDGLEEERACLTRSWQ